jgi:hypothetical protein
MAPSSREKEEERHVSIESSQPGELRKYESKKIK